MRSRFAAILAFVSILVAATSAVAGEVRPSDWCGIDSPDAEAAPGQGGASAPVASRLMSFSGSSPLVYQGYSGCSVGKKLWDDPGRTSVSYVRAVDSDPFRRLRGETFDDERFLDANWRASVARGTDVGSDFSAYTSDLSQSANGKTVAGGRLWLSGLHGNLRVASSLAVAGTDVAAMGALAQRHEVEIVALQDPDATVTGKFAYAEADANFAGTRSPATANQRTINAGADVDLSDVSVNFTYRRLHHNISEPEAPQRIDDVVAAGLATNFLGDSAFVPDRVAFRTRIGRSQVNEGDDAAASTSRSGAAGVNLAWGDADFHAGLDVDTAWSQHGDDRGQESRQTVALMAGGRSQGLDISSRLYTRKLAVSGGNDDEGDGAEVGWSMAAELEGREWQSSVRYRVERAAEGDVRWHWSLAAEVDALDLAGIAPSDEMLFAYGELDANIEQAGRGAVPGFGGRLVAGYKF